MLSDWIFGDVILEANGYLVLLASGRDLRALAVHKGSRPSRVVMGRRFIGDIHDLTVVSLSVDPGEMFDPETEKHMPHSCWQRLRRQQVPPQRRKQCQWRPPHQEQLPHRHQVLIQQPRQIR